MYKATTVSKVSAPVLLLLVVSLNGPGSVRNVEYIDLNTLVFSRLTACTRLQETIGGVGLLWETMQIGD